MSEVQFEPVRPIRAYERVVEQVETALQRGDLKTGERLPSERDLMKQFAVSRSTVREALRVLESQGVVRSRPGDPHGPIVLSFSPAPLRKSMLRLATGAGLSLAELLQFRWLLEGASACLAAELRSDDDIAAMESAVSAMRRHAERGLEAFGRADVDFHDAMAAASRNVLIQVCANVVRGVTLDLITDKMQMHDTPGELMHTWAGRHEAVLDAIRRRDGPLAASLMQRDIAEYYAPLVSDDEREVLGRLAEGMSGTAAPAAPRTHGSVAV